MSLGTKAGEPPLYSRSQLTSTGTARPRPSPELPRPHAAPLGASWSASGGRLRKVTEAPWRVPSHPKGLAPSPRTQTHRNLTVHKTTEAQQGAGGHRAAKGASRPWEAHGDIPGALQKSHRLSLTHGKCEMQASVQAGFPALRANSVGGRHRGAVVAFSIDTSGQFRAALGLKPHWRPAPAGQSREALSPHSGFAPPLRFTALTVSTTLRSRALKALSPELLLFRSISSSPS